jgi:hypothetical protein
MQISCSQTKNDWHNCIKIACTKTMQMLGDTIARDGPTLRQSVALATVDFLFLIDI